jgi:hypothetical protein
MSGNLCLSCMTNEFLSFELTTLFGTWWGIIGCVLGPFFLLHNLAEYAEGSIAIVRAKWRSKSEGQTTRLNTPETQTTTKENTDYGGVGKALGAIFVKPDVWRDIDRLRGYQVPESVANYEAAFARVAIIRETVRQQKTGIIATQMLIGIDQYIIETFKFGCEVEVLDHYKKIPLHIVAISYSPVGFRLSVYRPTRLRRYSMR